MPRDQREVDLKRDAEAQRLACGSAQLSIARQVPICASGVGVELSAAGRSGHNP